VTEQARRGPLSWSGRLTDVDLHQRRGHSRCVAFQVAAEDRLPLKALAWSARRLPQHAYNSRAHLRHTPPGALTVCRGASISCFAKSSGGVRLKHAQRCRALATESAPPTTPSCVGHRGSLPKQLRTGAAADSQQRTQGARRLRGPAGACAPAAAGRRAPAAASGPAGRCTGARENAVVLPQRAARAPLACERPTPPRSRTLRCAFAAAPAHAALRARAGAGRASAPVQGMSEHGRSRPQPCRRPAERRPRVHAFVVHSAHCRAGTSLGGGPGWAVGHDASQPAAL